jgi:hypothetical protein
VSETSSKARQYLTRTLHRYYKWMLRNPEMSSDAMQELELALVQHGYPEDPAGIRAAQNTLKRGLYRLHVSRGIMLHPVTCKLEQRYRQITNPHRFTGGRMNRFNDRLPEDDQRPSWRERVLPHYQRPRCQQCHRDAAALGLCMHCWRKRAPSCRPSEGTPKN